jgi:HlyD family secretion protein
MQGRWIASRLPAVAVLCGIVAAVFWALLPERVPVEVRPVSRGPLAVRVSDDGVTRIKERYIVSAPLAGRMSRVELHAGDPVVAGETTITVIEPTDPALLDPRAEAEALGARVGLELPVVPRRGELLVTARGHANGTSTPGVD